MFRALVTMQNHTVFQALSNLFTSPFPIIRPLPQTVLPTQEAKCVQLAMPVHSLGQILNPGRRPRASACTMATGTNSMCGLPIPPPFSFQSSPFPYDSPFTHMMDISSFRDLFETFRFILASYPQNPLAVSCLFLSMKSFSSRNLFFPLSFYHGAQCLSPILPASFSYSVFSNFFSTILTLAH